MRGKNHIKTTSGSAHAQSLQNRAMLARRATSGKASPPLSALHRAVSKRSRAARILYNYKEQSKLQSVFSIQMLVPESIRVCLRPSGLVLAEIERGAAGSQFSNRPFVD
jgi:hypothetical protein